MQTKTIPLLIAAILALGFFYFNHLEAPTTPSAIATGTPAVNTASPEPLVINMDSGAFFFKPEVIRAKVGQPVTVLVKVKGGMHTFTINELNIDVPTPGGKITEVKFTPPKPGSFVYYCFTAGHRQSGQWGTLIVE